MSTIITTSLKRYSKDLNYSYTYGAYATFELFKYKKEQVRCVLFHSSSTESAAYSKLVDLCAANGVSYEVDDRLIAKLSPKENTFVIGVFEKYADTVVKGENHVVLINPMDMGNLGTILRSMLAFANKNLILVSPCADIFDPKVVRASQGAIFSVRSELVKSLNDYSGIHKNTIYLFSKEGSVSLEHSNFQVPYSLVFGNESDGLSMDLLEKGTAVSIKQTQDVDSLNLALSVGIVLHRLFSEKAKYLLK